MTIFRYVFILTDIVQKPLAFYLGTDSTYRLRLTEPLYQYACFATHKCMLLDLLDLAPYFKMVGANNPKWNRKRLFVDSNIILINSYAEHSMSTLYVEDQCGHMIGDWHNNWWLSHDCNKENYTFTI